MKRYVCLHCHFYQPPRENPWLEAIEIQDSAHPYHDWNERINAECYGPNTASRILDGDGRIMGIVSNYRKISFNIGPTLLEWMEKNAPETYRAIIEADSLSVRERGGHGNALAQVYNHVIMPLADARDKRTQVLWGIRDFEHRFGRFPEGMWLPETAVDRTTLEVLATAGIRFVILAPHQAARVRTRGAGRWRDVTGERINPRRPYWVRLRSGKAINVFFYDGPISRAVAFEGVLERGESLAARILAGFSSESEEDQLVAIATDGETYGHHHRFGEMALTYALDFIERNGLAELTNYGEYLARFPPTREARIVEGSSWSCSHGIERWRSDCGCNSGSHPGWHQRWRAPLREALDWLRDLLARRYGKKAREYLSDPWRARDDYIEVLCCRSERAVDGFLDRFSIRPLGNEEKTEVLRLLEMQRHSMLMYVSCGWFFDELSGIETVQVLRYAARAIELAQDLFGDGIEAAFLERLSRAESNVVEYENGAVIFDRFVRPSMVDARKVGAHYAVSTVVDEYPEETEIFSYRVRREDYQCTKMGQTRLAVGRINVVSKITRHSEVVSFAVLRLGGHVFNGGVRSFLGDEAYGAMKGEITSAFGKGNFAEIIRLMDAHFGMHNYSLEHLFSDRQRYILDILLKGTVDHHESLFRTVFDNDYALMWFLRERNIPVPWTFPTVAAIALPGSLKRAFGESKIDLNRVSQIVTDMKRWKVSFNALDLEFVVRRRIEALALQFREKASDLGLLHRLLRIMELVRSTPIEVHYWTAQNVFHEILKGHYGFFLKRAESGDASGQEWMRAMRKLGELLYFNIPAILAARGEEQ